jgi:DNA (cytosine-5)-methyltransferase 1
MKLLDLFCGAGGAAMGYHRAGFEVTGVDHYRQPHYPFRFVQMDALDYLRLADLSGFDAIHASPPCQLYSRKSAQWGRAPTELLEHPDLVGPVRDALEQTGLPYVIENVPGAPLRAQLMLCGSMFAETNIRQHRLFEANWPMPMAPFSCGDHSLLYNPWKGSGRSASRHRAAVGADWIPMAGGATRKRAATQGADIYEAIPPAYTEWIGKHLLEEARK